MSNENDQIIEELLSKSDSSLTENDLIIKRNIEERYKIMSDGTKARLRGRRKTLHNKCPNDPHGHLQRLKVSNGDRATQYFLCMSCDRIVYFAQKEVVVEE